MDINSLLSPSDAPPADESPSPSTDSPRGPRAHREPPPTSAARQSAHGHQSGAPLSPSRHAAIQQRPPMPSPPGSNFSASPVHSSLSQLSYNQSVSTPPLERPVLHRGPPSGMDTLADLASMQQQHHHHQQQQQQQQQQAARSTPLRQKSNSQVSTLQRPSLQEFQRQHSGSRGSIDMSMLEGPKPKMAPVRSLASVSLTEAELKEVSQYFEHLHDHAHAYDTHVRLIRLLRKGFRAHSLDPTTNEIRQDPRTYELADELLEANESFSQRFAAGEELWLERLQDQQLLAHSVEECMAVLELFQKSITEEAGSTALWHLYGNWMSTMYQAGQGIDSEMPPVFQARWSAWSTEDKQVAREVFQRTQLIDIWRRGTQQTMYNIDDSHLIWDNYMKLRLEDLEGASMPQGAVQVQELFEHRLSTPHQEWDQTFQQFSQFVSRFVEQRSYEQTMLQMQQRGRLAKEQWAAREVYELKWGQARHAQDMTQEWLLISEYMEWELGQPRKKNKFSFDLSKALYQRALLRFPLHTVLWEDFFLFLAEELPEGPRAQSMLPAMDRGTGHCPWSGTLWGHYIRAGELERLSFEEMSDIKHRASSKGLLDASPIEEHIIINTNWCSYLRRRAFIKDKLFEDELDVTEVGIRSAIEELEILGHRRHGDDYKGDPQYRLERIYIRFCTQIGDGIHLQTARDIWKKLIPRAGQSWEFWQWYFLWERFVWVKNPRNIELSPSPRGATDVLRQALNHPGIDWPEKLIETLMRHAEDYEDPAGQLSAIITARKAQKQVDKRRAQEHAENQQLALRHQQAQILETNVIKEEDSEPINGKRKREEARYESPGTSKKAKLLDSAEDSHMSDVLDTKAPPLKRDRENSTVIASNLPASTDERRVRHLFRDCGNIVRIQIAKSGEDDGITAIIEFETSEDVLTARTRDMKKFDGQSINVRVATDLTVYCTNYPAIADEAYIRNLFSDYGDIVDIRFPSLKYNTHRRFCYVQFKTPAQAHAATQLDGRTITEGNAILKLVAKISDPAHKQTRAGAVEERREVYVANVDWSATEQELQDVFGKYGETERVNIPRNFGGKSKGHAFITFKTADAARSALDLDKTKFKSRILSVSTADASHAKRSATTGKGARSTDSPSAIVAETNGQLADSPAASGGAVEAASKAGSREDIASRTIALLDVPDTVNDTRVHAICAPHGELNRVTLRPDHGGAIVEFADVSSAGKASMALEGLEIAPGRKIRVGTVPELLKAKADKREGLQAAPNAGQKHGKATADKPSVAAGLVPVTVRRPGLQTGRRGGLGQKRGPGAFVSHTNPKPAGKPPRRDNDGNQEMRHDDGQLSDQKVDNEQKSNADFRAMFSKGKD